MDMGDSLVVVAVNVVIEGVLEALPALGDLGRKGRVPIQRTSPIAAGAAQAARLKARDNLGRKSDPPGGETEDRGIAWIVIRIGGTLPIEAPGAKQAEGCLVARPCCRTHNIPRSANEEMAPSPTMK
jgi:hypothetical protein